MSDHEKIIVDFDRILKYAELFPEMKMIRDSTIDISKLTPKDGPANGRVIPFVGPVSPGLVFGDGWTLTEISLRGIEIDFRCTSPDGQQVTLTGAPDWTEAPACPFDRPGFKIGYTAPDKPFEWFEPAANAFADIVHTSLGTHARTPETWIELIEEAIDASSSHAQRLAEQLLERRPDGKVYVRVTSDCQERCPFCFFYDTPQENRIVDRQDLDNVLDQIEPGTTTQIILTGGEPTLIERFEEYLLKMVGRGFKNISVQTNGILLLRLGLLDRFVEYRDVLSFGFSLHATTEDTNNKVTGVLSHTNFANKISSIRRATELGYFTKITFVVTTSNIHEMSSMVDFCASLRNPEKVILQFSMPVIRGRMLQNPALYPRLSDLRKHMEPALSRARKFGICTSFSPLASAPPCCLPLDLQHLESMWFKSGPAEWWSAERTYGPRCQECVLKTWCSGVSPVYVDWYGTDELEPFVKETTELRMSEPVTNS